MNDPDTSSPPPSEVLAEHADEAAFLWLQRPSAAHAPNDSTQQFADVDERLAAHIDGLRVAGEDSWRHALALTDNEGPEDFFVAAVLAIEAVDGHFDDLVERARDLPEVVPGPISALGWVEPSLVACRPRVEERGGGVDVAEHAHLDHAHTRREPRITARSSS